MPKEYPAEFKTKIIKRYQKGESIQSLSQELHIAQSTIYDWRILFHQNSKSYLHAKRVRHPFKAAGKVGA